jgi:CheY-like chemotaxis protein
MQSQKMEAIGTMAGGIAHDFNNMLTIILGNAEIALLDIPDDNPAKNSVNQIILASQRVKELVKQILTFSRRSEQQLLPLRLYSTVDESLKLLRSTIPTTVSIVQNFSEDCDTILGDPTQIHQLLMNLCSNAVYAMDEKGTLEISGTMIHLDENDTAYQSGLKPGNYLKLSVSDTGAGMPKAVQDRIFDPFYTTKGVSEGTGMGLAIVLGVVNSHGGFIKVHSEPGKGTKFSIYFPVLDNVYSEKTEEIAEEYPPRDEHLLFVDDEEMLAMMGGGMLERLGYKVTVKTSSSDALECFKANPEAFDLVITDQSMPNMSGAELSIEILKSRPDIPIILCTGYSKKITEKKAREIGIRKYLTKPFTITQLEKSIRETLAPHSMKTAIKNRRY